MKKPKNINSVWDYLVSTLPSEGGDKANNISALYLDDMGGQYDITSIDPSLEVVSKSESITKTVSKFMVDYNKMKLVKYTTSKEGYKIKIIKDKVKECKLTTTDKRKRKRSKK